MEESQPEPWLRGTLLDLPAAQRAVLHALQHAREDIERWCDPLDERELAARPYNLPSVAFHMRHIVGSLDRLLTYAEGNSLTSAQRQALTLEMDAPVTRAALFEAFARGMEEAECRIRALDIARWTQPRSVGAKRLPTTLAGLAIHCAEHTQRHVGQAITTAKLLITLRSNKATTVRQR